MYCDHYFQKELVTLFNPFRVPQNHFEMTVYGFKWFKFNCLTKPQILDSILFLNPSPVLRSIRTITVCSVHSRLLSLIS